MKEKVTPEVILEKIEGMRGLFLEKFSENAQDHYDIKKSNEKEFALVKAKQDHTNGDVTALKTWKNRFIGGMTVITALVLPLLIFVLQQYIFSKQSVDLKIKTAVEQALQNKDFQINER